MSLKPRRSRATKKERVDVTREVIERARLKDGPEVDNIALKIHRALDDEDWHEAKMQLASMTGHFDDEMFDLALRANMVLMEELEEAARDGRMSEFEEQKIQQLKRSVDTLQHHLTEDEEQKKKIEDYYAGSVVGIAKKRMEGTEPLDVRKRRIHELAEAERQKMAEAKTNEQKLDEAREYLAAGGSLASVKQEEARLKLRGLKTRIENTGKVDDLRHQPIYDLYVQLSEKEWQERRAKELEYEKDEARQRLTWAPAKKAEFEVHGFGHQDFTFLRECKSKKEAEEAIIAKFGPIDIGSPIRFHIEERYRGDSKVYLAYYYEMTPLQVRAKDMDYLDQIKVIRRWVKKHVPTVSVTRGTGTAYGYIDISAGKEGRMFTEKEMEGLRKLFGSGIGGNFHIIGPDDTDFVTAKALEELGE